MSTTTTLYALGSNGSAQLGVGHQTDLSAPEKCLFISRNSSESALPSVPNCDEIGEIVAGGNHTLLLTRRGLVYGAGRSEDGRCGFVSESDCLVGFMEVGWVEGREITDIAATWEASFLVEDGRVLWVCGSGFRGELGLGEGITQAREIRKVFDVGELSVDGVRIVDISGCMGHVVLVLSNGEVYGWGSCRRGQLGPSLRDSKVIWKPQKLDLSFAATRTVTGRDFTLLWNDRGNHFVFGDLSSDNEVDKFDSLGQAQQVSAGWSTIYFLQDKYIHGLGKGRRGQLPPQGLPCVTTFAAGSEHCVAILEDGRLAAWGWGEHGNCGVPVDERGNVIDRFNIISIPSFAEAKITGVAAGCASSFVWTINDG